MHKSCKNEETLKTDDKKAKLFSAKILKGPYQTINVKRIKSDKEKVL